jgi:hypothetical protein
MLLAFVTFGVGCGETGSSSATNAKTEIDPQDEARARRITFHRSDFRAGWRAETQADQRRLRRLAPIPDCLKLRWSDLTPTGTGESKVANEGDSAPSEFDFTFVSSTITIYANEDQARFAFKRATSDAFEPGARDKLARCFTDYMDSQADPDERVTDISFRRLPTPRLTDETAVHQVGKMLVAPPLTDDAAAYQVEMISGIGVYDDLVFLRKGRTIGVLTFFQYGTPWDTYEEEPLAKTVARRMGSETGSLGSAGTQGPRKFPVVSCGDLPSASITKIKARRLSCARARRIVRQFLSDCRDLASDPCLLRRSHFYCTTLAASYRYNNIGCVYQPDLRKPTATQRTVLFELDG